METETRLCRASQVFGVRCIVTADSAVLVLPQRDDCHFAVSTHACEDDDSDMAVTHSLDAIVIQRIVLKVHMQHALFLLSFLCSAVFNGDLTSPKAFFTSSPEHACKTNVGT